MSASKLIIELLGNIALLLWGIRMLTTGVEKAFGSALRHWVGVGLANRRRAFLTGFGVTALLQSSTATALMVTSFSSDGLVGLVPALAVMLGADVGTTLVVQVVSFDVHHIYPILLFIGVAIYRKGRSARLRETGRIIVGLALMFLSLTLLQATMAPLAGSDTVREVFRLVTGDRLVAITIAALFAIAALSSVATVLLIMSLQANGVVEPVAALAMVLGANLGSSLNPLLAARGSDPVRMRPPLGNFLIRLAGVLIFAPFLAPVADWMTRLGESPARMGADFHVVFNVVLAALFIGLLPRLAPILIAFLPNRPKDADPGRPLYLDQGALAAPAVAVSNAARETLRMADQVGAMLKGARDSFHHDDAERVAAISRMDDTVDTLYREIQRYLGAIGLEQVGEAEAQRISEIMVLAINLEHIGDIVDKNLMELAAKRIKHGIRLGPEEMQVVDDMHDKLLEHLQLALAVFMYGDTEAARRLVAEKEGFRDIERAATQFHFDQVRRGQTSEIEGSALRLDITRDLKRIEAHIAATAHGVLERGGLLKASRLEA
jgi:phosphate:Na+ symporter